MFQKRRRSTRNRTVRNFLGFTPGLTGLENRVLLSNYVVTNTGDSDTTPGTLRYELGLANADATNDTITFDSSVFGTTPQTITLTGGDLRINTSLTIAGPGADKLTISGNNASRIFAVDDGDANARQSVVISGLTLTAGNSRGANTAVNQDGGAIYNAEALTLSLDVIANNTSQDIGGGIYNSSGATVAIDRSTVANNRASTRGGGLYVDLSGTATITQSTFSGNVASGVSGGAIFNNGTLAVSQSTIAKNSAFSTGGAVNTGGTATFIQVTIADNTADQTGGVANFGTARFRDSLVVGNIDNNGPESLGSAADDGNNLIGVPSGYTLGNVVATDANGRPLLASNGGSTQTIALVSGSPAIRAGAAVPGLTTDQRGVARHAIPDIGAYERDQALLQESLVVTTLADENDGTSDPNYGRGTSLREAIAYANINPGFDTITFASNLPVGTITLNQGPLLIQSALAVAGPGPDSLSISGNNASQIFVVDDGTDASQDVTISGLLLTQASATNSEPALQGGGDQQRGNAHVV